MLHNRLTRRQMLGAAGRFLLGAGLFALARARAAPRPTTGRPETSAVSAPLAVAAASDMAEPASTPVIVAEMVSESSPALPNPPPPSGSALLDQRFTSTALGRQMPCFVYLPAGYAESGLRYPVLYMLHGMGGSNTEWIGYGFPETADHMMNAGEIAPMLIVLPQGDQAYWMNHADDGERWGDYTAQDVVRYIDATYRTIPDARHRGIGGLSMGAHGAMQLALNYPDTFGVVGMHSPTLRDFADRLPYFGDEAFFDAHDPIHLVERKPADARALKIAVDVGEQDTQWLGPTTDFHGLLTQLAIPHDWHTWPGEHDGAYWKAHATDYLRFYAAGLGGQAPA